MVFHFNVATAFGAFLFSLGLCSCGSIAVREVKDGKEIADSDVGFQFHPPVPYLLVTADLSGGTGTEKPMDSEAAAVKPPPPNPAPAPVPGGGTPTPAAPNPGSTAAIQIVYLPDMSKTYSVHMNSGFWGTFQGSLHLDNGWNLTDVGMQSDAKGPETITALTGILGALLPAGIKSSGQPQGKLLQPGLYLIIIDPQTGKVTGLENVTNLH